MLFRVLDSKEEKVLCILVLRLEVYRGSNYSCQVVRTQVYKQKGSPKYYRTVAVLIKGV